MLEREKGKPLKCILTNNCRECPSNEFESYCSNYVSDIRRPFLVVHRNTMVLQKESSAPL